MNTKPRQQSQYDFVKDHDQVYFDLLRLARITEHYENDQNNKEAYKKAAITALNQLPLYAKTHKRLIPLLNAKAHKLNIYDQLLPQSQQLLTTYTQQGIVTELAKKQQLNNIIEKLSEHNIPLILLKGAAFAGVLYSPQAPRTSNDLDILIQKKHWHQTVAIIKKLMNYTQKPQPDVFGDLYELSFIPKTKVGAALDLHSSLIHPILFNINEQQLWENSINHPSYNNNLVKILSPEHALIHQALHAYKDMDFGKYNLVDSHELISVKKPDIQKTIAIAKEWGATNSLYVLLKNCVVIMATELENDIKNSNKVNILTQIKPSLFTCNALIKLLKSRFSQPIKNSKPLKYRLNQTMAQFVFTGSVTRPLKLQWLFVKSVFRQGRQVEPVTNEF